MKKVVVVHLHDKVFSMEEEAYACLRETLDGQWQKEELETRVADLLYRRTERKEKVITLPDVVEVLQQLGIQATWRSPGWRSPGNASKKFYRQPDGKVIAGICNGLGKYFDIDPLVIRACFLATFLLGPTGCFIYVVLWIVIPNSRVS
ncbi:MAG: PspC domain-containing protein [Odoribacteraceae bacterium]|jgi:phage shock protein C|nr:PspC domain-containing protein [Odoribacteraceae bacterium]